MCTLRKNKVAIGMFEHPVALETTLGELKTRDVGDGSFCLVANAEVAMRQRNGADGSVLGSIWSDVDPMPSGDDAGEWLVASGHALPPAIEAGAYRFDVMKQMLGAWMPSVHVEAVAQRLAKDWLLLCVGLEGELLERVVPGILLKHSAASVQVHEFTV